MTEKKIMVVDDEAPIRDLFRRGFSRAGFAIYTAESAETAITMQQQAPCRVFFIDLYLPDMNGIELCHRIRHGWPQTLCYAVTGFDALYDLHEFRAAEFEDRFIKPVSLAQLLAAAQSAFARVKNR